MLLAAGKKTLREYYPLRVVGGTFRGKLVAWIGTSSIAMVQCSDGVVRNIEANLLIEDKEDESGNLSSQVCGRT